MNHHMRLICFVIRFSCLTLIFTKTHPHPPTPPPSTKTPTTTSHLNGTIFSNNTKSFTYMSRTTFNISNVKNSTIPSHGNFTVVDHKVILSKNHTNSNNNNTNIRRYNNSTVKNHTTVCKQRRSFLHLHSNNSCYSPSAALRCFHDPIFCKQFFTSGKRNIQQERPAYGEYTMLKHQHWFHVIQHGGIAFLFHPCAEKKEIENLRQVASQCLHRYVLAPYRKLSEEMPLALVSWGCFYMSTKVDELQMMNWIRKNAYSGPASHVNTNGKFKKHLVKHSKVLTDVKDAILCPNEEQLVSFKPTLTTKRKPDPESIIHKRVIKLNKIKPGINISANISLTKVETGSAVWAAASLVFLCGILVGWLLYTKLWSSNPRNDYRYAPLGNENENRSFECEPGQSQFNLLKSSQQFMSTFQWKGKQKCNKKDDPMMKMNLMVPINEEDDDEEVQFER